MKNNMKTIMEGWRKSTTKLSEAEDYSTDYLDQVLMKDFVTKIDRARGLSKKYASAIIGLIEKNEKAKQNSMSGKVMNFLKKATVGALISALAAAVTGATGGIAGPIVAVVGAKASEAILSQIMADVEEITQDFLVKSFVAIQKEGPPKEISDNIIDMNDSTELLMKGGDRDNNKSPVFLAYIKQLSSKWDEAIDKFAKDVESNPQIANTAKVKDYLNFTADSFAKNITAKGAGLESGQSLTITAP